MTCTTDQLVRFAWDVRKDHDWDILSTEIAILKEIRALPLRDASVKDIWLCGWHCAVCAGEANLARGEGAAYALRAASLH